MDNTLYYYEDKPYRVLHEGKVKTTSILKSLLPNKLKLGELIFKQLSNIIFKVSDREDLKWVDVVIYTPVYPECEFPVCVKEKEDFYKNYKQK